MARHYGVWLALLSDPVDAGVGRLAEKLASKHGLTADEVREAFELPRGKD